MSDERADRPSRLFGPFQASAIPSAPTADPIVEEWLDSRTDGAPPTRRDNVVWLGWRLRLLVIATLAGCVGLLLFIRFVAATPVLTQTITVDATGRITIMEAGSDQVVTRVRDATGRALDVDAALFEHSPRWIVDDSWLHRVERQHDEFAHALTQGALTWTTSAGTDVVTVPKPLGVARLGAMFWILTAMALALYLVVIVVFMARPNLRNVLYALATLPQAVHLLFIAFEGAVTIHMPLGFAHLDHGVRGALDVVTAAAMTHSAALHPRPLPWRRFLPPAVWIIVVPLALALLVTHLPAAWWIVQGTFIVLGTLTLAQFTWSYRTERHPLTFVLRRFGIVTLAIFVVLTAAVGLSSLMRVDAGVVRAIGGVIWVIFLGTLLVATPFMSRSQPTMREFSMLAGVSTMATALDLLFVAVFSLGDFASLTLALFLSLMAYAGVRQWILNHMLQTNVLTTERMFEQLYRIARDVEAHPHRLNDHFSSLLRELYDPIEVTAIDQASTRSSVIGGGAALVVPTPGVGVDPLRQSIALRYAHRGKRLFTPEDARLTDRLVEQLARAVAFDQAVERGRTEERVRIAQDLHDDIGARLLTLMYKAPNAEVEDYIRHTLHELKTLTRGLAAVEHRLSHAIGEWKADMTHRLGAARCDLVWSFSFDEDLMLSVVQWSALTRIIRELVNNVIAHGHATQVALEGRLLDGHLRIRVADDGTGRSPQSWSAGLGLGGIRKRVKLLSGHVRWEENQPRGIVCIVDLKLDGPPAPA